MATPSQRSLCNDRFRASTVRPPARFFSDEINLRTVTILHSQSAGGV
jgi:hypothetical protein